MKALAALPAIVLLALAAAPALALDCAPGQWNRARFPGSGYLPREVYSSTSGTISTWR